MADAESYERVEMTAEKVEGTVSQALRKVKGLRTLPPEVYSGLFPTDTRLPEFYGLPKIHKVNVPLRPVVAAFVGTLAPVSIFLERVIHQLLRFVPCHIENTAAAIRSLEKAFSKVRPSDKVIVCTMDVVALYPSIPIEDGIVAVMEKLKKHKDDIDIAGLSPDDIESLLRLVLLNNYFRFGEVIYHQTKGVAMGNHLAPPLAIIFMDKLEQDMLQTAELKPETYDRYVDDCLVVWTHGEENLVKFVDHCNRRHPNIRFTWESSARGQPVSYMDLQISITDGNQLVYELFQKPSDSGVNLNFESCIPQRVKVSVAAHQFRRAAALSSNAAALLRSEGKIEALLRENSFPEHAIKSSHEKAKQAPKRKETCASSPMVTLQLPFCSDSLHTHVQRIVKKCGLPVKIRYSSSPNLKKNLVRSALHPGGCIVHARFVEQQEREKKRRGKPYDDCISCQAGLQGHDCDKKFTIYWMKCKFCSKEYVGESQRPIRTRLHEHQADGRKRSKGTPWGEHMWKEHIDESVTKEPVFTARILAVERNPVRRKAREAIEIRDRKPAINRNGGWKLD